MCGGIGESIPVSREAPDGRFDIQDGECLVKRNGELWKRINGNWEYQCLLDVGFHHQLVRLGFGNEGDTEVEPVAPDGESRPPTPEFVGVPGGHNPSSHRWTEEWLRQVIREEIQEAFAQRVRERNAAWNRTREGED